MSDMGKNIVLWLIILAVLLTVFNKFDVAPQTPELSYSDFLQDVEQGQISSATIQGDKIYAEDTSGNKVTVTRLSSDLALTDRCVIGEVQFKWRRKNSKVFGPNSDCQLPNTSHYLWLHVFYAPDARWRWWSWWPNGFRSKQSQAYCRRSN